MLRISLHKSKTHEVDMTNGPLLKKIIVFTIPILLSGLLQLLFNATDVVVVGIYAGDNALAAVGSNGPIINLLTNLFIGLSAGSNVVAAHGYGSGDRESVSKVLHTSIVMSLICGVMLLVFGVFAARTVLIWMATPDQVLELSTLYLRIYFVGMPAVLFYNFGAAILRAAGDTKRPLYYLMFSGVINVGLNLLFVIVLRMDVAGVALATVIAQYISAILILRCLIKESGPLHFQMSMLRIDKVILKRIVQIGLPAGIQGTVFSFSNVVIQSSVNSFGPVTVAGSAAAANLEGFVYMAMNSLHQSCVTFSGQNYGAGKLKRVLRVLLLCQLCVIVVGVGFGNFVYQMGVPLLHLYSSSDEVVSEGLIRLKYVCQAYALCGCMDVMVGALRGIGYSVMPMIVSMLGACGLRLLWIATYFQSHHTTSILFVSYPGSWIITTSVHILCFVIVYRHKAKQLQE